MKNFICILITIWTSCTSFDEDPRS